MNKSQKKLVVIIISVAIFFIVFGGLIIAYLYNLNKPVEETWGQTYYVYLKDIQKDNSKSNIPEDAKNKKIGFIDVSKELDPVMLISYELEEEIYTNVYYINEEKVDTIYYNEPVDIKLLYNISREEYNYYIHSSNNDVNNYNDINNIIDNIEDGNNDLEPEYSFSNDDSFNEYFIAVEEDIDYVDYKENLSKRELREVMEKTLAKYETQEDIITEEVKEDIASKLLEMDGAKEQAIDELYDRLLGLWLIDDDTIVFEFMYKDNEKFLIAGPYGTEAVIYEPIIDIIKISDNIYKINTTSFEIDINISEIDNNRINIWDNNYTLIDRDIEKAGNRVLEMRF